MDLNAQNGYRTNFLHLRLRQIVYGNAILQFDANAKVKCEQSIRALLHQASMLWQLYDDATVHIKNNGVTPEWGDNSINSIIAELSQL